jgi:hypothetical protein
MLLMLQLAYFLPVEAVAGELAGLCDLHAAEVAAGIEPSGLLQITVIHCEG